MSFSTEDRPASTESGTGDVVRHVTVSQRVDIWLKIVATSLFLHVCIIACVTGWI